MVQVGPAVAAAGGAVARLIEGRRIGPVPGVLDAHRPLPGEHAPVPRHARGQHAVKHVHAPQDALHDVRGRAHAHHVARAGGGQELLAHLHRLEHLLLALPHRQTAQGMAVKAHLHDRAGALLAQVREHTALHDAEQRLARVLMRGPAALLPAQRALQRCQSVLARRRVGRTLVKGHRDVGAEGILYLRGKLRRQQQAAAVHMGAERHPLLADVLRRRQREDLEAAAVREYRPRPVHEGMEAAQVAHEVMAGPLPQVIGIAAQHLNADALEVRPGAGPHDGLAGAGHERGRRDGPARGLDAPEARAGGGVGCEKVEGHGSGPASRRAGGYTINMQSP